MPKCPPAYTGIIIIDSANTAAKEMPKIVLEFINQIQRYDLNIPYGLSNLDITKFFRNFNI